MMASSEALRSSALIELTDSDEAAAADAVAAKPSGGASCPAWGPVSEVASGETSELASDCGLLPLRCWVSWSTICTLRRSGGARRFHQTQGRKTCPS